MLSFIICLVLLIGGYFVYGNIVNNIFSPDDRETPAVKINDGVDYVVMPQWKLFLIQLLNIAGLGPIFGALQGALWGPVVFLWITFGTIFAGGVHDFFSGMMSERNDGASISEVCGIYLGHLMQNVMRVFSVVLLVMVGTVFAVGPAGLIVTLFGNSGVSGLAANKELWLWIILAYYFIATFISIDKIIGKIYPVFGICLIIMALGVAFGIFTKPEYTGKSTFLYVILLTLCVPLAYVYLILVTGLLDKIQEGHIGLTLMIVFLPLFFYWGLVAVVGIINIGQSFKIYKTGNPIECVNRMLIHKYGLVVFFCVNFLVLFIYYFFISMAVLVGSRGAAIIFAPVLLPWLIVAVVFSVGATWLAILPGSFYGIQVIRMTYKSGKIGFAEAVVHTVFQFFFLFDVLDAMYLATEKWGRGKKSSVIIGCVYLFAVFATIYLIIKMKSMF